MKQDKHGKIHPGYYVTDVYWGGRCRKWHRGGLKPKDHRCPSGHYWEPYHGEKHRHVHHRKHKTHGDYGKARKKDDDHDHHHNKHKKKSHKTTHRPKKQRDYDCVYWKKVDHKKFKRHCKTGHS